MKFKCVNDQKLKMFGGYEQISGLTKGKEYMGSIVTPGQGGSIMIVVFDDAREWSWYLPEHFEPVET